MSISAGSPAAELVPYITKVCSQAKHVEVTSANCHLAFNWGIALAVLHRQEATATAR